MNRPQLSVLLLQGFFLKFHIFSQFFPNWTTTGNCGERTQCLRWCRWELLKLFFPFIFTFWKIFQGRCVAPNTCACNIPGSGTFCETYYCYGISSLDKSAFFLCFLKLFQIHCWVILPKKQLFVPRTGNVLPQTTAHVILDILALIVRLSAVMASCQVLWMFVLLRESALLQTNVFVPLESLEYRLFLCLNCDYTPF